jgi:hypothetical protein
LPENLRRRTSVSHVENLIEVSLRDSTTRWGSFDDDEKVKKLMMELINWWRKIPFLLLLHFYLCLKLSWEVEQ